MILDDFLSGKLKDRVRSGSLRTLSTTPDGSIDFSSNDYLGMARSMELQQRIHEKIKTHKSNGATGSRLLSGNDDYTVAVEQKLATVFNGDACLIFNSGYSANLAVLSSIPQRGDTILYDELAHACIKDGARLSMAKRFSFKHNDLIDLENKLQRAEGNVFIAVESIYSMDGDACPLAALVSLAEKYNAIIILDEAHSTGVMGTDGSGLATSLQLEHKIGIRVYTFGKAMGIHGACVVGSSMLIEYIINFARPFIYTTALPPHSIAAIECSFEYLAEHQHLQKELLQNIQYFKSSRKNNGASDSAIQPYIVPGNAQVKQVATALQMQGFDVRPILSPTVKEGTERLRICLHAYNNQGEMKQLMNTIDELSNTGK